MKNSAKISRFLIVASFVLATIGFHANTSIAQHPCDTFPVTGCVIPSSFTSWTVNDNNASATAQASEPQPIPFYNNTNNPLKTTWWAYVAPMTGIESRYATANTAIVVTDLQPKWVMCNLV